jgi:hypothetical protein
MQVGEPGAESLQSTPEVDRLPEAGDVMIPFTPNSDIL